MNDINEILIQLKIIGSDDATLQIGNLDKAIRELNSKYKNLKGSTDENSAALGKNRTEVKALEAEKSRLLKTTVGTIQSNEAEEGSLTQLRISLSKSTAEYNRMGEVKRNSVKGKELETSIINQTQAISALEQKMGNFRRNVGNYASGWNGLANSINQVTREMPNFAQSATIGFMALSNNLPILADEINKVRLANLQLAKDGEKTTSVFKQIATSLFSWQSVLITAISLSVIYSKEIMSMISGHKELSESEKDLIKTQEETNVILSENINAWKVLRGEITDTEAEILNITESYAIQINKIDTETTKKLDKVSSTWNKFWTTLKALYISNSGFSSISVTGRELRETEAQKLIEEQSKTILAFEAKRDAEIERLKIRADQREKDRTKTHNKTLKDKEERDKELLDMEREYQRLLIENKYEGFAEEVKLAELSYKHETEDLKKKGASQKFIEAKEEEHQIKIHNIKEKWINLNAEIAAKGMTNEHKENTRIQKELSDERIKNLNEAMKGVDDYEKWKEKQAKEKSDKEEKNRKLAIDAAINAAKQTVDAISQIKQNAIDRDLKRQLTAIQRASDGEDRILENRLKNGIISEGQYNDAKQKLNQETADKELEANRKAFEEKKRLDTATAIANGALAITSILAQYPKFDYGISAAIAIGAAVATTATQVAVIQAQKFALGGKVDGKSHAQGGVMIEAEGGEGMINKNSMQSQQVMSVIGTPSQIASAINTTGGGVSWEAGATLRPNPNLFSNSTSSQSITYAQMDALLRSHAASINDKKVIILESDITKTQNKVKSYEANGRF